MQFLTMKEVTWLVLLTPGLEETFMKDTVGPIPWNAKHLAGP